MFHARWHEISLGHAENVLLRLAVQFHARWQDIFLGHAGNRLNRRGKWETVRRPNL